MPVYLRWKRKNSSGNLLLPLTMTIMRSLWITKWTICLLRLSPFRSLIPAHLDTLRLSLFRSLSPAHRVTFLLGRHRLQLWSFCYLRCSLSTHNYKRCKPNNGHLLCLFFPLFRLVPKLRKIILGSPLSYTLF